MNRKDRRKEAALERKGIILVFDAPISDEAKKALFEEAQAVGVKRLRLRFE